MAEFHFGPSDDGQVVVAHAGDFLIVRLPENPSTGYRWNVSEQSGNLLRLDEAKFLGSEAAAVGSGGERALRFFARDPGYAQIALRLRREWEDSSRDIQRYTLNVQILP